VNMRNRPTRGTFAINHLPRRASAEVLGESRQLETMNGEWSDDFAGYAVHLYRLAAIK
jgi:hypothetical protein